MSGRSFIASDRDQTMLLPPDLRDWLPADHLVWMVLDTVSELDLSAFYAAARRQPRSRPGYQPSLLVALLVYSYTIGVRSSREIERRTREDVAFRVISATHTLDHATIARFRARYANDLAGLFEQVLGVCFASGMGRVGSIAIDGTKIAANAARHQNRTRGQLPSLRQTAERLIAEAEAIDKREDALYGAADGGSDLPPELADPQLRKEAIRRARNRLAAIAGAEKELTERDAAADESHQQRLAERAAKEVEQGRRFGGQKPRRPTPDRSERVNLTDPQSRLQKTADGGCIQGLNAQIAVSDDHLVLAALVSCDRADQHLFQPIVRQAVAVLARVAPTARVVSATADYGYFSNENTQAFATDAMRVLIAPGGRRRSDQPPDHSIETCAARKQMRDNLQDPAAAALYKRRGATVEPVIGDIKQNKNARRFSRRGREANGFEFLLICLAHNISRLHNYRQAQPQLA